MKTNLIEIVNNNFNAKNKWCLVIGDLMLDQYIFGNVERISPEAPVPVLKKNNQALLMENDFDEVFMESPVMNSDSSSPEGLDL